jgi:hypothetical protein
MGDGGRRLAVEIASKEDSKLKSLYEIYYEIERAKVGKYEANNIRTYLNLDRQYLARICPLNIALLSKWHEIEVLEEDTAKVNVPNAIFKLEPNSIALITFDFRHLAEQTFNWVYGEDYAISITMKTKEFKLTDPSDPDLLPEQFLSKDTSKSQVLEFSV